MGNIAIFALIWWIFAIINIVFCVKTGMRYKKLGMKGAAKRIILSWLIVFSGIIVGSIFSVAVNSKNPITTLVIIWGTCYIFEIIAIFYTNNGARNEFDEQDLQEDSHNVSNDSVKGLLYVRFNIDSVGGGAYGMACYKIVFANAPANALRGCKVSMGDSNATLSGREYVCIIGLAGPVGQLRAIMNALNSATAFTSVCANNPLVLNGATEPLVEDGTYTEDGSLLSSWAKSAFNSVKKDN